MGKEKWLLKRQKLLDIVNVKLTLMAGPAIN